MKAAACEAGVVSSISDCRESAAPFQQLLRVTKQTLTMPGKVGGVVERVLQPNLGPEHDWQTVPPNTVSPPCDKIAQSSSAAEISRTVPNQPSQGRNECLILRA